MEDLKRYILWVDYGCEGWAILGSYDTPEEAIKAAMENCGSDKLITKRLDLKIVEE